MYGKDLNQNERPNAVTRKFQTVDPELTDFLGMNDIEIEPKKFNINSFSQIGMVDPFPFENKYEREHPLVVPVSINDMVYDYKRYYPANSVPQIYIPRKELMYKLMRACMGVEDASELWFNRNEEPTVEEEEKEGNLNENAIENETEENTKTNL